MAISKASVTSLPGASVPWGRLVERRLDKMENTLGQHQETIDKFGSLVDKTVVSSADYADNYANGLNGKQTLPLPVAVQFVSGTGLFEVTVSFAGLSMAGANIGMGVESDLWPADIYFDLPQYGVAGSSANADVRYIPIAGSRSTIITARPGVYNFNLYLFVNTTITVNSQAYLHRGQLSVKAV